MGQALEGRLGDPGKRPGGLTLDHLLQQLPQVGEVLVDGRADWI